MRLYFLRHGEAEERQPGLPDSRRRLTPEGEAEMRRVARALRTLGLRFDAIFTSPLVRARETAACVVEELGAERLLREEPRLAGGCGLEDLAAVLRGAGEGAHVLLVGHEPDFSTLVGLLIGGGAVRMKKAGLACVELPGTRAEEGAGELRWLLDPRHAAAIAGN